MVHVASPVEQARLAALESYGVLDTDPEQVFDELVAAAAEVAGVPTALVSLVDEQRQWFKARIGMDVCSTDRDAALCDHVVRARDEVVVPDTWADPRFADNALVVGAPHIRFYAGFPLMTPGAHVIGTLCAIGYEPHQIGHAQAVALRALAGQVMSQLEVRSALARERQARAEATAHRQWVDGLLDVAPAGVVACDALGRLSRFNLAARHFHGLDADPTIPSSQWAGSYSLRSENGRVLAADEVPLLRALRGEVVAAETMVISPAGRPTRIVRCDGAQLHDADGRVSGALVVMTDVTARQTATERLRRSEQQMREALDAMPRDITLLQAVRDGSGQPVDLVVAWINAQIRRATGLGLDDVVGRPLGEVFPAVAERFLGDYLEVVRTGDPVRRQVDDFAGQHLRGAVDVTAVRWAGEDGVLVDAEDITDRRVTEVALAASRDRLQQAQELAGIATWSWDLRTGEVTWSVRLRELFDAADDVEPSLEHMVSKVHPDDRDQFEAGYASLLADGGPITMEHRIAWADGTVRWVRTWADVERDATGAPTRIDGSKQEVTDARLREALLAEQAHRDELTGIPNRRGWRQAGRQVLEEVRRAGLCASLAMIDLDHFKSVNDRLGHAAGDDLLRACALRWQRVLRAGDVLARLGGEEFAVLLPGCDIDQAATLVERLRSSVPAGATASAGLVLIQAGELLEQAVGRADAALYQAKDSGRDRCCVG